MKGRRGVLVCWALSYLLPSALLASSPLRVWEADFNDPEEPGRWQRGVGNDPSSPLRWELVPRNASDLKSGSVLYITASRGLGVETQSSLYRPLPRDFRPDPAHTLVVEWEWKIVDTEVSDGVLMELLAEPRVRFPGTFLFSHTRYTQGWGVAFDQEDSWVSHRIVFPAATLFSPSIPTSRVIGPILGFLDPVNQRVYLSRLRVEEWLPEQAPEGTSGRPHRAPPPVNPFAEKPIEILRQATAGALEDLDGDGLPEILAMERGLYVHLYRGDQAGGDEEITTGTGLERSFLGTGAVFVDVDGDGDKDLVVTGEFDTPRFFENHGDLRFVEDSIVGDEWLAFWYGCAADDVDRDGDPDFACVGPAVADRSFLFIRNRGGWRLDPDPAVDARPLVDRGDTFSVGFVDTNGDHWPELALANEYLFRNERGRFVEDRDAWPAMNHLQAEGVVGADFTGDGATDLLILRDRTRGGEKNTARILAGDGHGHFEDRTRDAGIPPFESAEVALAEDFDNDGDRDLYVCQRNQRNLLLLNDGAGHFADATEASGLADDGNCDSAVAGDLDGDGGMDVVIFRYNSAPALLHNRLPRGHWLGVIVEGLAPGTDAIGAEVRILERGTGNLVSTEWARRGRGFGSTGPSEIRFGLRSRAEVDVEVRFPSGAMRRLDGVRADRTIPVREPGGWLGTMGARLAEARLISSHSFRRFASGKQWVGWGVAALAAVLGFAVLLSSWVRLGGAIALAFGFLIALALGSRPGAGVSGSPPELWLAGALAGAATVLAARGTGWMVTRLGRGSEAASVSLEELVRHTIDFRHSQVESTALLSIHNRVVNLFFESRHREFLDELQEMARRFPEGTGARLRGLLRQAAAAFPGKGAGEALARTLGHVEGMLAELEPLQADRVALRSWQPRALVALNEIEDALPEFLLHLDELCACEVGEVVEEIARVKSDLLRARTITVSIRRGPAGSPLRAVIGREDLLLVLENLFTNSVDAMTGTQEPRIEISVNAADRQVQIEFCDNGRGIPPGDEERIFERSFTTRPGGKGYGLARSRELLEHYGGRIMLGPDARRTGALFLITLRSTSEL